MGRSRGAGRTTWICESMDTDGFPPSKKIAPGRPTEQHDLGVFAPQNRVLHSVYLRAPHADRGGYEPAYHGERLRWP